MSDFYADTLLALLRKNVLRRDMKILVICAGDYDRDILQQCGFTNVTLSNLGSRARAADFAPFDWSIQDAEQLTFADNQFDVTIAHSGLHHCRSPHRALLEMYRVSRVGVIVLEPSDNLVTRLGVRLGLGQEYEVAAVAGTGCRSGGQTNTPIPNYVYRWTRREVEKTISSYDPLGKHKFLYFHKLRVPWYRSNMMRRRLVDVVFLLLTPLAQCLAAIFPSCCNNFAFVVVKPKVPDELHPWLKSVNGSIAINTDWIAARYRLPETADAEAPVGSEPCTPHAPS